MWLVNEIIQRTEQELESSISSGLIGQKGQDALGMTLHMYGLKRPPPFVSDMDNKISDLLHKMTSQPELDAHTYLSDVL